MMSFNDSPIEMRNWKKRVQSSPKSLCLNLLDHPAGSYPYLSMYYVSWMVKSDPIFYSLATNLSVFSLKMMYLRTHFELWVFRLLVKFKMCNCVQPILFKKKKKHCYS